MTVKTQPLKWHGGKSYLSSWLHSLAPPSVHDNPADGYTHRNIVFAGGLGEFWNWEPIEGISETVNDANDDLANLWAVLSHPELFDDFHRIVGCLPLCEDLWRQSGDLLRSDDEIPDRDLNRAVAFFIRYRQSRQGLAKDYTTPTTRTRRGMNEQVSAWLSAVEGLPECHQRLIRVEIRNMNCIEFIKKYDHPRALFYCYPPYLHETRSSTGEYGKHEMKPDDHTALLSVLSRIKGKFMLSGYPSEMYRKWQVQFDWRFVVREIDNKASSAKTKEKKTEVVWMNY